MNEEEIIEHVEYSLINPCFNNGNSTIINNADLQGLLDLYNKEKEKNKKYKESITFLENKIINQRYYIKTGIIEKKLNVDSLCKTFDLISKDKIKDNVEYIRFMVDDNKPYEIVKEVNLYLDLFLQELLEERN